MICGRKFLFVYALPIRNTWDTFCIRIHYARSRLDRPNLGFLETGKAAQYINLFQFLLVQ